jgi:hypothetical protein
MQGITLVLLSFAALQSGQTDFRSGIRPIIERKCVVCHQTGGQAPFPLQSYAQVRRRADLIRLVCLTGQMPPTDAHSDYGSLTPAQPLNPTELRTLQNWIRLGLKEGPPTPPLPPSRAITAGETDHSFASVVGGGTIIPPEGRSARIVYRIPKSFNSKYLGSFLFQPNAPQAVRQAVLAVQRSGSPPPFTSLGIRPNTFIASWSSGFNSWPGQSGGAVDIEPSDQLWLQVRAVPTGKVESGGGMMRIGREFKSAKLQSKLLGLSSFEIPAEAQTRLHSEWILDRDIALVSMLPEARFATEQIRVETVENGIDKELLVVLTWDATWPGAYNFLRPVALRKGTKIVFESIINNSKHGHAAEGEQTKPIRFGPRAEDELFWCHLQYIPK